MPVSARKSQLLQQLSATTKAGGKVDVSGYHKTAQAVQPSTSVSPAQPVEPPQVTDAPVAMETPQLSEEEQKLADFEAAIAEAVPATILANTPDPLNPVQATSAVKKELAPEPIQTQLPPEPVLTQEMPTEPVEPQVMEVQTQPEIVPQPEQSAVLEQVATPEQGVAGVQVVEHEPKPEISPEVSEYLKEVETHQELQPHEVVLANQVPQVLPPKMLPKPVIVLPITPEIEDIGSKKGVMWSIRWLVEWSQKIMKMFSGKVIYKEAKAEV